MRAGASRNALAGDEWKRHWTLVLAAGSAVSLTAVTTAIIGLFIEPWTTEFGWSRTLVSSGMIVGTITTPLLSPFVGAMIDRKGTRHIALPGIVLLTLSTALLGLLNGAVWMWFAIWALHAVAALATAPTVWTAAVSSAFAAGRGLALGLTLSGSAFAQATAPVLTYYLIEEFGWRIALVSLATGWGGLAFLLCFFLLFDGYHISQMTRSGDEAIPNSSSLLSHAPGLSIAQARRSPVLWKIGMSTFLTFIVTMGIVVHQIPILRSIHVSRETAVYLASMAAIAGIFGKLVTGWLLDRFPARWVGGGTLAANVATFVLLLLPDLTSNIIFVAMLINGYTIGTKLQITSLLTSVYAGMRNFGAIFGAVSSLILVGSGLGPLLAGAVFDRFGSYEPFLMFGIGATVLSAALVFTLPGYPEWSKPDSPPS